MALIKIGFANYLEESDLEEIAVNHGWKERISNPGFDEGQPEGELNPREIDNPQSKVMAGIFFLAKKTGAVVVHETTFPKIPQTKPVDVPAMEEGLMNALVENFELTINDVRVN